MPKLNELGQTVNNAGNIYCQKTGTEKRAYLSPHTVRNSELMKLQGWEIIMQPELPPSFNGNGVHAENKDQHLVLNSPVTGIPVNVIIQTPESNSEIQEEINEGNQELNEETGSELNNRVEFGNEKIESTIPAAAKIKAIKEYSLESTGKKRGRPFGSTKKKTSKSKK